MAHGTLYHEKEGPPGGGAGGLAGAEEEDPIAHLNRLMETRNALMRQALH